jgi:hypothetical protein
VRGFVVFALFSKFGFVLVCVFGLETDFDFDVLGPGIASFVSCVLSESGKGAWDDIVV